MGFLDFGFTRFITPALIRVLFIGFVILASLATLAFIGTMVKELLEQSERSRGVSPVYVIALLGSPFAFIASVLVARVLAELALVAFKIEEGLRMLRQR